jgi:mannose-6-phosphate isomerase
MHKLINSIKSLELDRSLNKQQIFNQLKGMIEAVGYEIVEQNESKPWGGYFRFSGEQADLFVEEFFPGLGAVEARLGNKEAELSPKIMIVSPEQRLSWQYHNRRAERWAFLTDGAYNKSENDDPGELIIAKPGDVVQFLRGERHRLVGVSHSYTLVAEIWQHVDGSELSDEDDIVRLMDDYSR